MGSFHTSKQDVERDHSAPAVRTSDTDVVTLKAMRFHTHIGVLPHEAEIAQSIEVDASVWVARRAGSHGSEGVVDYRRLYDLVLGIVGAGHIRYLEDLADRVADEALNL